MAFKGGAHLAREVHGPYQAACYELMFYESHSTFSYGKRGKQSAHYLCLFVSVCLVLSVVIL